MAMIGRKAAVAEIGEHRHELHGRFAFAAWLGVHASCWPTPAPSSRPSHAWAEEFYLRPHHRSAELLDPSTIDTTHRAIDWKRTDLIGGEWRQTSNTDRRGRPRDLRNHRRPGQGDDVPVALPAGDSAACSTARSSASRSTTGAPTTSASTPARRSRPPASESTRMCSTGSRRGCRICPATSPTRPRTSSSPRPSRAPSRRSSTWRSRRSCSARWSRGSARGRSHQDRPDRGREAVRPRPRVGPGAGRRAAPVRRRVAALPDRPLPRQDGHGGAASTFGSPTRCSSRSGTAITSSRCRSRWRRASASRTAGTSTIAVGALRDVCVNHLMQLLAAAAMEPPAGRDPRHDQEPAGRALAGGRRRRPGPLRARAVRRLPRHRRRGPDSTTETYAALRLEIDNWRWSGVPFFIRTGKRLPVTQTEFRLVFKRPPGWACRVSASARPSRTSSSSGSIRPRRFGSTSTRTRRMGEDPRRCRCHGVRAGRVVRRQRRTRCCCRPRWSATAPGSPGRTASRRAGASCSRCSIPGPGTALPAGDVGSARRRRAGGRQPLARTLDRVMTATIDHPATADRTPTLAEL